MIVGALLEAELAVSVARIRVEEALANNDRAELEDAEEQLAAARDRCRLLALALSGGGLPGELRLRRWA